jgi:hypothetical protein
MRSRYVHAVPTPSYKEQRFQRVMRRRGAPDTIRTCDLCLRRATLYPAELRVRLRERARSLPERGRPRKPALSPGRVARRVHVLCVGRTLAVDVDDGRSIAGEGEVGDARRFGIEAAGSERDGRGLVGLLAIAERRCAYAAARGFRSCRVPARWDRRREPWSAPPPWPSHACRRPHKRQASFFRRGFTPRTSPPTGRPSTSG